MTIDGTEREAGIPTGAGCCDAILYNAEHDQCRNEREPDQAPHHAPNYRSEPFAARPLLVPDDQKEQPMNIREVMTRNPRTVSPDDSIQNAARIMRDEDTGAVPVVEDGRPVGMVTDRDIVVRAVADGGLTDRSVRDIVSTGVVCATPDMSTRDASELMREHQVRRLPVVENERIIGIVSLGDLAVKEGKDRRTGDTLQEISAGVKESY